jgi:hypothetical protein
MTTSSVCGALSFLGIIISNSYDSFFATILPTITPPRGIPNVIIFSLLSLSFLVIFLNASPRIFPELALSLNLN